MVDTGLPTPDSFIHGIDQPRPAGALADIGRGIVLAWISRRVPEFGYLTAGEVANALGAGQAYGLYEEVALVGSRLREAMLQTEESQRQLLQAIARFVQRLDVDGVEHLAEVTPRQAEDFIREPSHGRTSAHAGCAAARIGGSGE